MDLSELSPAEPMWGKVRGHTPGQGLAAPGISRAPGPLPGHEGGAHPRWP